MNLESGDQFLGRDSTFFRSSYMSDPSLEWTSMDKMIFPFIYVWNWNFVCSLGDYLSWNPSIHRTDIEQSPNFEGTHKHPCYRLFLHSKIWWSTSEPPRQQLVYRSNSPSPNPEIRCRGIFHRLHSSRSGCTILLSTEAAQNPPLLVCVFDHTALNKFEGRFSINDVRVTLTYIGACEECGYQDERIRFNQRIDRELSLQSQFIASIWDPELSIKAKHFSELITLGGISLVPNQVIVGMNSW